MVLTVKALREQLSQLPAQANEWPVVLAQDAEGNGGFSPLAEAVPGYYDEGTQEQGDWTDSGPRTQSNAVCLWPLRRRSGGPWG